MVSKDSFSQGINNLLASIDSSISKQVLNAAIPLLGDKLKDTEQIRFVEDIRTAIVKELAKAPQNLDAEDIEGILNSALGDKGLKVLKQAINVVDQGGELQFNLKLGQANSFSTNIATDLGISNLNLQIDSTTGTVPQAKLDYDYNFDLDFTVDSTGTVKSNYGTTKAKEIEFNIKASTPDLQANANLGPLKLTLSNDKTSPTSVAANFVVDLDTAAPTLIKNADSLVSANLNLDATTSFDSSKLPSLNFDFLFNWKSTNQNVEKPKLEFDNINLELGSFFKDYASPILEKIESVLKPVDSVVGFIDTAKGALTKNIPFLTEYAKFLDSSDKAAVVGQVTLLDLVKLYNPKLDLTFLSAATATIDLVKTASSLVNSNAKIDLGSFNIGNLDLRNASFSSLTPDTIQITDNKTKQDFINQLQSQGKADIVDFFNKSNSIAAEDAKEGGFDFKLINDPKTSFSLLLGQPTTLFSYDMPALDIYANIQQFFSILGPLGATVEGEIGSAKKKEVDFSFGYEFDPNKPLIDGFYVSDWDKAGADVPEIQLEAALNAYASLNVGVASGGAGGGVKGTLDLNLNDIEDATGKSDGKLFASELAQQASRSPFCIFDASGAITAGLRAYISYGFGPFKKTTHFDGGSVTLATFEYGCGGDGQPGTGTPPILATKLKNNVLRLNVGKDAGARKVGNTKDIAESFAVSRVSGKAGEEQVAVSGFGFTQNYKTTSTIVANGGAEADTLIVNDNVVTGSKIRGGAGTDYLKGGAGKDTLYGEDDIDKLEGGANNDKLFGSKGNDLLIGGSGADKLDGNEDNDTASYSSSKAAVDVSLTRAINRGGDAKGDTLVSVENLEGSQFSDSLGGNKGNNILTGLNGDDKIFGKDGDDLLDGGVGKDTLDGGNGIDSVSYGRSNVAVDVNLATGSANGGDATGDQLLNVENVEGTNFDDVLIGNDANNILSGGRGRDILTGGAGDDTLLAGYLEEYVGKEDELTGGAGQDSFVVAVFRNRNDDNDDVDNIAIKDFNPAEDKFVTNVPFANLDISASSFGTYIYAQGGYIVFERVTDSSLFNTSNVVQADASYGL